MSGIKSSSWLSICSTLAAFSIVFSLSCLAAENVAPGSGNAWYVFAFLLGAFAGMAEILSRYRDEPWRASFSVPGIAYIFSNGLISTGAYWTVITYKIFTGINEPGFPAAIAAGFGSMAIFRSKIFVYRSDSGNEYPIGPDIVLDIFMKTIDRQIDRKQAVRRQGLITNTMSDISGIGGAFDKAADYFDTALLSFQHLTKEDKSEWKNKIDGLKKSGLPEKVKLYALGYALLDLTGEDHFHQCIDKLKEYIK